jgi:hypothetical protein
MFAIKIKKSDMEPRCERDQLSVAKQHFWNIK